MAMPRLAAPSGILLSLIAGALALAVAPGDAHKPITSPFTYNDDVFPVLRDRCGACHVEGGVGPMALMTHEETVPWGESIRVELLAGRMPPWNVEASSGRFRNVQPLTAKEMNLILTWATGGTPFGSADKVPPPVALRTAWPLGAPDVVLPFPNEITLAADVAEDTVDVIIPTGLTERRWVRAADLLPGTAAIVRSATIRVRSTLSASGNEPVLAVWQPGDVTVAADGPAAFELPAGAELLVRVHYKKTWQNERKALGDRSSVGLYFAPDSSSAIRAIALTPDASADAIPGRVSLAATIDDAVRTLAIYPSDDLANAGVIVTAVAPGGTRRELIAFKPRAGWAKRYWFTEPVALERGTRVLATISPDDEAPALPLAAPVAQGRSGAPTGGVTLNVSAGR